MPFPLIEIPSDDIFKNDRLGLEPAIAIEGRRARRRRSSGLPPMAGLMWPVSTLRGSPSLAPVTAHPGPALDAAAALAAPRGVIR